LISAPGLRKIKSRAIITPISPMGTK